MKFVRICLKKFEEYANEKSITYSSDTTRYCKFILLQVPIKFNTKYKEILTLLKNLMGTCNNRNTHTHIHTYIHTDYDIMAIIKMRAYPDDGGTS
jgi:hypothetical protein